jgi:hypothetical protein
MKLVCTAAVLVSIAQAVPPQPQRQAITSNATAILVDAVVRDKNGNLITDLAALDFELAEDGVAQTIDSFTRVSHGGGIGVGVAWKKADRTLAVMPTARPETSAAAPLEDAATVALVYDHLSAESLSLAQKATLGYVPLSGDSDVRVGVFAGTSACACCSSTRPTAPPCGRRSPASSLSA